MVQEQDTWDNNSSGGTIVVSNIAQDKAKFTRPSQGKILPNAHRTHEQDSQLQYSHLLLLPRAKGLKTRAGDLFCSLLMLCCCRYKTVVQSYFRDRHDRNVLLQNLLRYVCVCLCRHVTLNWSLCSDSHPEHPHSYLTFSSWRVTFSVVAGYKNIRDSY